MTNQVKIVVVGDNKFKPTEAAVLAGIKRITTVTEVATKAAAKFDAQLTAPKTAEVDKVAAVLDKAGAAADRMSGSLDKTAKKTTLVVTEAEKLNKETAKPKTEATDKVTKSLEQAAVAADSLLARMRRVGTETSTSSKVPLGVTFRAAVQESSAALDELVLKLYTTGVEMGDALSRGLRLDVVRGKFTSLGRSIGTVLDRALDPVRRLRAAGVSAADAVGEAWDVTTDRIQEALAAAARAAVAIGAAAMVPVRQVRLFAVEAADAVGSAWGRAVDNVTAKSRAVGNTVASIWERALERVQRKARETSEVIGTGYDRAMLPARRAGTVVVGVAEKIERAWSRASAPVFRFGRAVGDVAVETGQLAGRIVSPFAKVGGALVSVLADAGTRGGQAVVRGVATALDGAGSAVGKGAQGISRGVSAAFDKAGDVAGAARRMGTRAVDALAGPFASGVDGITKSLTRALPRALNNPAVMGALLGAAVPLGAAAGGALVFGFGAGLATLGMVSVAKTSEVRGQFRGLIDGISDQWQGIVAPFKATMGHVAKSAGQAFETFRPALQRTFSDLAPDVSVFSAKIFQGLGQFAPAIKPLGDAFSEVMVDIGGRFPRIVGDLADRFIDLSESIERNPKALGQMVEFMGDLTGLAINELTSLNALWGDFDEELQMIDNFFTGKGYKLDAEVAFHFSGGQNAADIVDRVNEAFGRSGVSSYQAKDGADRLEAAWSALADAGDDLAKRGSAVSAFLDLIAGRTPTYEESAQAINDSIRGLGDLFGDAANHVDGYGSALLNANNTVDTTTKNGSALYDTVQDLQDGFANAATSVRELEDAGWSHDAAVNRVNEDMRTQYDRLVASADQMGLTKGQMEGLLAAYGLTPHFLDTMARLDENGVPQQVDWMTRNRTMTITAQYLVYGNPNTDHDNSRRTNTGWGVPGQAHGGVVSGGWTTVGEMGPERVKLPPGAQVQAYTASQRQMEPAGVGTGGGGGGDGMPTLNLAGMPPAGTGRQFIDWLTGELRRQGVKLVRT